MKEHVAGRLVNNLETGENGTALMLTGGMMSEVVLMVETSDKKIAQWDYKKVQFV